MSVFLHACIIGMIHLFRVHSAEVKDDSIKTAMRGQFESVRRVAPNGTFESTVNEDLCDMVFSTSGFFDCNRCLVPHTRQACNFLIKTKPVKQVRVYLLITEAPIKFEIQVIDGTSNRFSTMDKVITEFGDYVFDSSAGSMYIRIDGRRFNVGYLKFSFYVEELATYTGTTGCLDYFKGVVLLKLPNDTSVPENKGRCYWKFKRDPPTGTGVKIKLPSCPSDKTNCYLRFLGIYEGVGMEKTRLNEPIDLDKTEYEIPGDAFVVEYYGCPLTTGTEIYVLPK